MKSLFLLLLTGVFSLTLLQAAGVSPQPAFASSVATAGQPAMSKKELRDMRRSERRAERLATWSQRLEKFAPKGLDVQGNLRYALLAAGLAFVLSVVAFIMALGGVPLSGLVSWIAYLCWLVAIVFLVLWLIEEIA